VGFASGLEYALCFGNYVFCLTVEMRMLLYAGTYGFVVVVAGLVCVGPAAEAKIFAAVTQMRFLIRRAAMKV
jgi:hypothetical protein